MDQGSMRNLSADSALADVERRFAAANPRSRERFEAATRHMPGGSTRFVSFYPPFPAAFVRGRGARLWDMDGHEYLDLISEQSAAVFGHDNAVIASAAREAIADGIALGGPNRYEGRLAELVCSRFPSIELVRFCNSGSEANALALSTARAFTGRAKILAIEGAYHGGLFSFPNGPAKLNAPYPTVLTPYNSAEAAATAIRREAADLAAIIVEPMMGAGGCIPAEPEFVRTLRDEATKHGVVLIFDEVMTSRTGPSGLQGRMGVTPDMTTLGKYLGGGFSIGAFGGRSDIMSRFDSRRSDYLHHSGTFNNNVCSMAAGVAAMERVFTPEAATRLNAQGDALRARLIGEGAMRRLPVQVTGVGSLLNIHFLDRPIRRPEDALHGNTAVRNIMHLELMLAGFYLARRGFIALSLPHSDADIDVVSRAFGEFLDQYAGLIMAGTPSRAASG